VYRSALLWFSVSIILLFSQLRRRIEGSSLQKPSLDLSAYTKTSSEYYTPEEMLQFKKPKKKKSLRKKEKLDLDALEAEAIASGLGPSDLGSRKDTTRLADTSEQEKSTAEARKNTYQAAIEKAEAAIRVIREEQVQSIGKTEEGDRGNNELLVFGDDYEDLQRSVEQTRKLVMKKKEDKNDLDLLKAAISASEKKGEGEVEGEAAQGGKVIITEMEEFVWGLQLKEGISFVWFVVYVLSFRDWYFSIHSFVPVSLLLVVGLPLQEVGVAYAKRQEGKTYRQRGFC
jgi:U4/U6.U5 tri-snRNP-associated protein 1